MSTCNFVEGQGDIEWQCHRKQFSGMVSTHQRADSYERMVKFFKIWVKVWLHLLATCASSGWALFLESILHAIHYFFLGFMVFGTVIGVSRSPTYRLKTELCLYLVGAPAVIFTLFRVRRGQRKLIVFFQNVLCCTRIIFGENCFRRTMQSFKRICSIILPIFFLHYTNVILVPFWKTATNQDFEHHRVDVTSVPHFLTCRNVNVSRASTNLCWDLDNSFQSLVKNVSVTFAFFCTITPFSVFLTFFAFVIIFVKANVLVICEELNVIAEYIRRGRQSQSAVPTITRADSLVHKRLSKVIMYYLEVYRNMNHVTPVLVSLAEYFMLVFYLLSLFVLAPILKEHHLITDPIYAMKSATTIIIFFIAFLVFCYGGQIIQEMNLKIAEEVYNLPWYDDSVRNQQLIYNFLLLLHRPCQIFVFYRIKMELRLSLVTLYRMYSLMNIILSRL